MVILHDRQDAKVYRNSEIRRKRHTSQSSEKIPSRKFHQERCREAGLSFAHTAKNPPVCAPKTRVATWKNNTVASNIRLAKDPLPVEEIAECSLRRLSAPPSSGALASSHSIG